MNTPVSYELLKLLRDKGFDESQSVGTQPTITEVVMWIYKKADIWIGVKRSSVFSRPMFLAYINDKPMSNNISYVYKEDPGAAYEAAIKRVVQRHIV